MKKQTVVMYVKNNYRKPQSVLGLARVLADNKMDLNSLKEEHYFLDDDNDIPGEMGETITLEMISESKELMNSIGLLCRNFDDKARDASRFSESGTYSENFLGLFKSFFAESELVDMGEYDDKVLVLTASADEVDEVTDKIVDDQYKVDLFVYSYNDEDSLRDLTLEERVRLCKKVNKIA